MYVSAVAFEDANFFGQFIFFPVSPRNFLEGPFFAQMRCDYCVLELLVSWDEFVKEAEEFVDLGFGKVGIVGGVFDFKCEGMFVFSGHDVWERAETGVADGYAHGVVAVFLEQFD